MRKANLISGVILLIVSLLLLFWIIPWQVEEAFGGEVSPRLLPQICAIGMGVLSVVLICTNFRAPANSDGPAEKPPISWFEMRAMLVIGGLLALGIFLFTTAGPIVASIVLIVGILFAMGERSILPYILIPSVLLVGSWVLFYQILGTAIQ